MKKVTIVGGGILGLSAAYYLQKTGQVEVTLIDADDFAAATTSQAASLLTQARSDINTAKMVAETYRVLAELECEFSSQVTQRCSAIHLLEPGMGYEQTEKTLLGYVQQAQTLTQDTSWLNADRLAQALPMFHFNSESRGLAYASDSHVDPYLFSMLYAKAARTLGVKLISRCRVRGIRSENNQVTQIELADGNKIHVDTVLLAAGPWSINLLAGMGVSLPMACVRSHYWITNPIDSVKPNQPMLIAPQLQAYFRAEHQAILFGVRDSQPCIAPPEELPNRIQNYQFGEDSQGWNALAERWEHLVECLPALEYAELKYYISGISAYTPDAKPLLGRFSGWQNLYVATGCSGAGIALSGGIGRLLSEQILEQQEFVDSSIFRPDRFDQVDPFNRDFQMTCLAARSNKSTG